MKMATTIRKLFGQAVICMLHLLWNYMDLRSRAAGGYDSRICQTSIY